MRLSKLEILMAVMVPLVWGMGFNTFVIYFSLPPLVFQTVASATVEQLTNWPSASAPGDCGADAYGRL